MIKQKETREERFRRLAEARVNKILQLFRLLGNLSWTGTYAYTRDQVEQIFTTLQWELTQTKRRFLQAQKHSKKRFSLGEPYWADDLESEADYPGFVIPLPDGSYLRAVGFSNDMRIEDEHISDVLAGKETILPEAVKKTIRESAGHHAKDILDKLRELQVDLRANPAVFIGGGSILFREYLEKSSMVASATFLDDPCANAIGYKVLAEAQRSLRTV